MHGELVSNERFGTMPTQALVVSREIAESCKQPQFTTGGLVSAMVTDWLQKLLFPHWSVSAQVRVMTLGQTPFVTVLAMVTITFVPLHSSNAAGGSKFQVLPH